jgi:archaemetzincin
VRVRLLELGDVPPRLGEAVLAGLRPPIVGGEVEQAAAGLEPCRDANRGQLDAGCVLQLVPTPPAGWSTIGLVGVDLFLPALTYVFGASELGARRGVLSWVRLRPEQMGEAGWRLFVRRVTVELVHELGHALGLIHCPVTDCPMHRTLWAEAVDLKNVEYCPACRAGLVERLRAVPAPP